MGPSCLIVMTVFGVLALTGASAAADEGPLFLPPAAIEEFVPPGEGFIGGLAVGPEGAIWFSRNGPGQIDRLSPSGVLTGEFTIQVGDGPDIPEDYGYPTDIAMGGDHNMWFVDQSISHDGQNLIGRVTPAGAIQEFPIPKVPQSSSPYYSPAYSSPRAIARGADGNIWFTDDGSEGFEVDVPSFIGRVTPSGEITDFLIPTGTRPNQPTHSAPGSIALGADGNMWFTDDGTNSEGHNLIGRITPSGAVTEFPVSARATSPGDIALGADGNMWFTQYPGTVGRITPTGVVSEYLVTGIDGSAGAIAQGPDGNMWFGEGTGTMGRITSAGAATVFSRPEGENIPIFSLVQGVEGELWYPAGANRVARLTIPIAPTLLQVPVLSGSATQGAALSVTEGVWQHDPSAYGYQWQVCDTLGLNCDDLAGGTGDTVALTAAELGHTLRAVVSASNIAGAASAVSSVSAVVQAPPPAPAPRRLPPPAIEPLPVIGSAMTWNFSWTRRYTTVGSLVVRDVPPGGIVEVTCRGRGCAFVRWRSNAVAPRSACKHRRCQMAGPTPTHGKVDLAELFKGRRLMVGARVIVTISKAGWIGKSFVFTVRTDRPPRVQITCLGSGPNNSTGGC